MMKNHDRKRLIVTRLALLMLAGGGGLFAVSPAAMADATTIGVTLTTLDLTQRLTPQPGITLGPVVAGAINVSVDNTKVYQDIDGFGAAFTDTSAYLLQKKLGETARTQVMNALFNRSVGGIGLSLMRVPMGSSDFTSTPPENPSTYSYDDNGGVPDLSLANFSIKHDYDYIIPIIKQAQSLNPSMKLFANPWSPPAWMKTSSSMIGDSKDPNGNAGTLKSDVNIYNSWAQYFVKFLQEYQAQGVNVWGITPQNEPYYAAYGYAGMVLSGADQANLISNYLQPALTKAGLNQKILGVDHNVDLAHAKALLGDAKTYAALYGTAWHCYTGNLGGMSTIHDLYPAKRIYLSECSTGPGIAPMNAAQLVLESTNSWGNGALLWNLALDTNGGPKMGGGCSNCTGLIAINQSTGSVTYNDNYYQLGQFSKFIPPGASHIGSTDSNGIWAQAYRNPDNGEVLVALNNNSSATQFTVTWNGAGSFNYTLPAGATVTFTKNSSFSGMQLAGQEAGKCVNNNGGFINGIQQSIATCDGKNQNQRYIYSPDRELKIGSLCLGAENNGTVSGTKVISWSCNRTPSQKWTFEQDGTIRNDLSGLCLDVTARGTNDGTPVQLWACNKGANQNWSAVSAS
uniref:ricin-type beta-trefoil lectin domain protein n=1 Tax=Burkholderia arboris TaxID=488730 RepID=UPI003BEEF039